jgi:hypothetical protein
MESSMNDSTDPIPTENSSSSPTAPAPGEPAGAAFSRTIRPPRFWRIAVVTVSGLVLLVSAALTFGASPSPSPSTGTNETPSTDGFPFGNDGWLPAPGVLDPAGPLELSPGKGFDRGWRHGRFGGITITAIDGSNLSLKTDDGWTRTIGVTSSTKITKGGQTIALSDLKVGDSIGFSQTRNDDGTFTIDAIAVLVPTVAGEVSEVSSNGFTLKSRDGTTWTISVNGSTAYKLGSADGSRSDVKVGSDVVVSGEKGTSDTSLTAQTVHVRVPVVFGQVTAKSGNTITIKRADGTTQTIHVGGGTTYRVRGVDDATLSDITVGMTIVAQGSQRSDGSIDATAVAGGGLHRGFKLGPRFGFPNGQEPTPSASPDGSSTES